MAEFQILSWMVSTFVSQVKGHRFESGYSNIVKLLQNPRNHYSNIRPNLITLPPLLRVLCQTWDPVLLGICQTLHTTSQNINILKVNNSIVLIRTFNYIIYSLNVSPSGHDITFHNDLHTWEWNATSHSWLLFLAFSYPILVYFSIMLVTLLFFSKCVLCGLPH